VAVAPEIQRSCCPTVSLDSVTGVLAIVSLAPPRPHRRQLTPHPERSRSCKSCADGISGDAEARGRVFTRIRLGSGEATGEATGQVTGTGSAPPTRPLPRGAELPPLGQGHARRAFFRRGLVNKFFSAERTREARQTHVTSVEARLLHKSMIYDVSAPLRGERGASEGRANARTREAYFKTAGARNSIIT
jgi:hypothetical protein